MNAVTSIYIPCIETEFNAEFIADVFDRNGIAQISRVFIEPNKNDSNKYNRAYVGIKLWHDTETAFNFISRLRDPNREVRLVYSDDNWWPVDINKYPNKLASNKRVLTLFEEKYVDCYDELSATHVTSDEDEDFIQIDAEKTELLRSIICKFQAVSEPIRRENSIDIDCNREFKANIYGYKSADEMEAAEAFDGYLHEIETEREKWFSEQYIYDTLNM